MKRLYTTGLCVALGVMSAQVMAQSSIQKTEADVTYKPTVSPAETGKKAPSNLAKGADLTVYWQEDFSDGLDGWTTSEAQGDLWFQTFPVGAPNGYDPAAPLVGASELYGTSTPGYFGSAATIDSDTEDNGFAMLDADRFWFASGGTAAVSSLISPSFDLTGAEDAAILFYQRFRSCCSNSPTFSLEVSFNDGETWAPYDVFFSNGGQVNVVTNVDAIVNITPLLQDAPSLENVRIKFTYAGGQTHYYWMLDDIRVTNWPENDLKAKSTYFGDYTEFHTAVDPVNGGVTAEGDVFEEGEEFEYYWSLEHYELPTYQDRPMVFGMVVENIGKLAQTEVVVNVNVTSPSTATTTWTSEPITMESMDQDTIFAPPVYLSELFPDEDISTTGRYTFTYSVSQAEEEQRPSDNGGVGRGFGYSADSYQNGADGSVRAFTDFGQSYVWSTFYSFDQSNDESVADVMITHVEFVLLNSPDFAETLEDQILYVNVRKGVPYYESTAFSDPQTEVLFDSENNLTYDADELAFITSEANIWDSDDEDETVWASFQLPSPILIEPGEVYGAEVRVPQAQGNIAFIAGSGGLPEYATYYYNGANLFSGNGDPLEAWSLTVTPLLMRFRTNAVISVDKVTYEAGVKLVQNYPNPFNANTQIQFQLDESSDVVFEVTDITGKVVHSNDMGTLPAGVVNYIDFSRDGLAAGMYTYSIVTPTERITRKMVIQ